MMVRPVNLFDVAAKQAALLSARQLAVATNVANANTVGYKAIDVKPFSAVLGCSSDASVGMARTDPAHFSINTPLSGGVKVELQNAKNVSLNGNNVDVEQELSRGAEISQQMMLNNSIVKSFHQMYMNNVKG